MNRAGVDLQQRPATPHDAVHPLQAYLAASGEGIASFAARVGATPRLISDMIAGAASPDLGAARRIAAASGGAVDLFDLIPGRQGQVVEGAFSGGRINDQLLAAVIEVVAPAIFPPHSKAAAFVAAAASNIYDALAGVSALSRTDRLAEALRPALQDSFAASPDCGEPDAAARLAARLYLTAESRLSA